ncbi:MAG: O-antigen ligase family protein [Anaerolineae bacterium]|nr:O-antigen ligase family protein [Gloeobacterales cyanobacterium ES-bin-313]
MISSQQTAENAFPESQNSSRGWTCFLIGLAMLPVSTVIFLFCWLFALLFEWRGLARLGTHGLGRWLLIVSALLTVMCAFSYRPQDSLVGLFNYLPFFLFFGLTLRLVTSQERIAQVIQVAVASGLITGLAGTFEWFSGVNWWWEPIPGVILLVIGSPQEAGILERVTSFFGWPTSAATFFLMLMPLLISSMLAKTPKGASALYAYSTLISMGIALIGTASRNAWGIALLACGSLLIVGRRFWLFAALLLVTIAILISGLGSAQSPVVDALRHVVPPVFWQKVSASVQTGTSSYESLNNRYDAWHIAWDMTQKRPLTGWGLQTFPVVEKEVYGRKADTLLHAHNLYLTYTAETGIPTALVLISFYVWTLIQGIRSTFKMPPGIERWQLIGLLTALSAYLLFGISDVPFYDARINALIWVWMALIWRHAQLIEVASPPKSPHA